MGAIQFIDQFSLDILYYQQMSKNKQTTSFPLKALGTQPPSQLDKKHINNTYQTKVPVWYLLPYVFRVSC